MSKTIPAIFRQTVAAFSSKDAIQYKVGGDWLSYTYGAFHDRVTHLASALLEMGVGPGERVALISENRPEWLFLDQAVLSLGAVLVPLYPSLAPDQARYILNDAGAMAVFASTADQLAKIQEIRGEVASLQHVCVFDEVGVKRSQAKVHTVLQLLQQGAQAAEGNEQARAELSSRIGPEWLASIVYTSGTTGEPKGAMLSHGNFSSNALTVCDLIDVNYTDTTLSFLPLCHVLERIVYYVIISRGATIAIAESIDKVGANLQEVRPTFMAAVPRVLEKVYARVLDNVENGPVVQREAFHLALEIGEFYHDTMDAYGRVPFPTNVIYDLADRLVFKKFREKLGGRLRFIFSGAAPLPAHVGQLFRNSGIPVVEGYGLTETAPVISVNPTDRPRFGTVGKPIPGVHVRLADDGEILVKGPNVIGGYWHKPEATKEAIDSEGWFHTGDIGNFDDDGYLRIIDRKKELIVMSNGKKVPPQLLENRLREKALVDQAMVVGEGKNYLTALIVPNFEALESWAKRNELAFATREDLLTRPEVRQEFDTLVGELNATLASFERIKTYVILPTEWTSESGELTPSLKIKRRVVVERYRDRIESLYTGAQPLVSERVALPAHA